MTVQSDLIALINSQQALVEELIEDVQSKGDRAIVELQYSYTINSEDIPSGIVPPLTFRPPISEPNLRAVRTLEIPELPMFLEPESININVAGFASPELQDYTDFFRYNLPTDVDAFRGNAPNIKTNFSFPTKPNLSDIDIPTLSTIEIPERPEKPEIPPFNAQAPVYRGRLPAELDTKFWDNVNRGFEYIDGRIQQYADSTIQTFFPDLSKNTTLFDTYLCDFIQGNIKAIPAKVWDAIYARYQGRNDEQLRRITEEVADLSRRTGNPYMSSSVRTARYRAEYDALAQNADANVQIIGQEAEREFNRMTEVLNHIRQTREVATSLWVNVQSNIVIPMFNLVIQFGNSVVDSLVKEYDAWIKLYEADIRLYLAEAQVYETIIKYVFIDWELHRQILEAAKIESELNIQLLQQTEQRIHLDERLLTLYGLELDTVEKQIMAEELKIKAFKNEIEVYAVYIEGKRLEISLFESLMSGDEKRIQGDLAKLEAYKTQLSAEAIKADVQVSSNNAKDIYNRILKTIFDAELQVKLAEFDGELKQNTDIREIFKTLVQQNIEQARIDIAAHAEELESLKHTFNVDKTNKELSLQARIKEVEGLINEKSNLGQMYANVMQSLGDNAAAVSTGINQFIGVTSQESL